MILNPNKCHYACTRKNTEGDTFKFDHVCLDSSKEHIILGINIDNKLTFDNHIKGTWQKDGQKLNAPTRILLHFGINKKKPLFKKMVESQFSYCLLIWMFYS